MKRNWILQIETILALKSYMNFMKKVAFSSIFLPISLNFGLKISLGTPGLRASTTSPCHSSKDSSEMDDGTCLKPEQ